MSRSAREADEVVGSHFQLLLDPRYFLGPTAFFMVLFISLLLTRATRPRTGVNAAIFMLLLGTMVAMLVGPAYLYLTTLSFGISDVVVWEIAVFMSGGMVPIFALTAAQFVFESDPERKRQVPLAALLEHKAALRAGYIFLLVLSEFMMGWTFGLASGLIRLSSGYSAADVARQIQFSVTSYWFVFTMAGEMVLTIATIRRYLRPSLLKTLSIQTAMMFFTPTALAWSVWKTFTIYGEAALMTILIAFAISRLRGLAEEDRSVLSYLGLFIISNAVMMLGLLLWLLDGDSLLLAASLVVATVIYFDAVFTGAGLGQTFRTREPSSPSPLISPADPR
ncbi:MAG: hypothetical protein JRN58_07795 [Nitrososphaerota archaeon]|nr:hypothetical protein [Nitrososphaerota archaeon]MDG6978967.1 hypothetical protein [Nitrososphaerota archaeon]